MFAYEWDNGEPLSARGDESTATCVERTPHTLLRPIFINAVEVGYAYSQCDKDRRLNVRGVTLALWYFISRGHQVVALLPYCFKSYSDKSSSWAELMTLFKMNLIEFTPGFGSDKYVEVNRILATRADEVNGCIVARSQMHNIVEERPMLNKTVEKRLLMPSFNGNDIIFPVDGPLGRSGPTLQATLECDLSDAEWGKCSHHQMTLRDQRIWMQKLTLLVPEILSWSSLLNALMCFSPKTSLPDIVLPHRPVLLSHPKIHPPETNPIDGKGYSYTRAAIRRNNPEMRNGMNYRDCSMISDHRNDMDNMERDDPFLPEYMRSGPENHNNETHRFEDSSTPQPNFLGNVGSIYRISTSDEDLETRPKPPEDQLVTVKPTQAADEAQKAAENERFTKLARIFGFNKAKRVVLKYPKVRNINLLVEFALNESDSDMSSHEDGPTSGATEENRTATNDTPSSPTPAEDLIDFTAPQTAVPASVPVTSSSPPTAQSTHLLD